MKFEVITEDQSGEKMLEILIPKILKGHGNSHEFRITVASTLKNQLLRQKGIRLSPSQHKPYLLKVIGMQLQSIADTISDEEIIVIVIDTDGETPQRLTGKLTRLIEKCSQPPPNIIALAIEEGEAWFLGDKKAIGIAFPAAKSSALNRYKNYPENGNWEILADAVFPGGAVALRSIGYPRIGMEKCNWSKKISPHMNVDANNSPSFCQFRDKIRGSVEN